MPKHLLQCVIALFVVTSAANAFDYMYLSDSETTVFGDRIKFWHEDTLAAAIRTNECFSIMENPVITGTILMAMDSCESCWDDGYGWGQYDIHCGVPIYPFPVHADWLRSIALGTAWEPGPPYWQGEYFDHGNFDQAVVHIHNDYLLIWWGMLGVPVDTTCSPDSGYYPDCDYEELWLDSWHTHVLYFDCPLRVSGVVSGKLIIASSHTIGIEDNIVFASSNMPIGNPTPGHDERFALVSEGDIKILNTPANGRENSNGMGFAQNNPSLTDIVLSGFYVALGESFTFEQQNDPDSGYVCNCQPDDRGTIYLWGGLAQKRRGYVHRSNLVSTGYGKQYRWDPALADFDFGVFNHEANRFDPDSMVFGEVTVGDTVWDTLHVDNYRQSVGVSLLLVSPPFVSPAPNYLSGQHLQIPVRFAPSHTGTFSGIVSLNIAGKYYQIPLRGQGVSGAPPIAEPSAFPNPFNTTTTFAFALPEAGPVKAELFDLLGRRPTTLVDDVLPAGRQVLTIDGQSLGSGVYFVRLMTPSQQRTLKLLLLK